MGTDIFFHIFRHDFDIIWVCRTREKAGALDRMVEKYLRKHLRLNFLTTDSCQRKCESYMVTTDLADTKDCDLIIETVIEDEETKKDLIQEVEKIVSPQCILTTNTSSIELNKVFEKCDNLSRCLGLHFFYPLKLIRVAELNLIDASHNDNLELLKYFLSRIVKHVIVFNLDINFGLYRLYITMLSLGHQILLEKEMDISTLETCIRESLFSYGLFKAIDIIGMEICSKSVAKFINDRTKGIYRPFLKKLVYLSDNGYHGGKGKKGLTIYEQEHCSKPCSDEINLDVSICDEVRKRMLSVMINEMGHTLKSIGSQKQSYNRAVQELFGMQCDPISLASQIGHKAILNTLLHYHSDTGDAIYKPIDGFSAYFC